MRNAAPVLSLALGALVLAGCAGPERKLGRGLSNVTEFARMGEMSRSIEQTSLWDGPERAYTTGVVRGFNRSLARTAIGAFEVVTFAIPTPTYDAMFTPKGPLVPDYSIATYNENWGGLALPEDAGSPDSYQQIFSSDPAMDPSAQLGVTSGEILGGFPLGRFRVND